MARFSQENYKYMSSWERKIARANLARQQRIAKRAQRQEVRFTILRYTGRL